MTATLYNLYLKAKSALSWIAFLRIKQTCANMESSDAVLKLSALLVETQKQPYPILSYPILPYPRILDSGVHHALETSLTRLISEDQSNLCQHEML
eukprot:1154074-Pelagomonas_calceolata.AAC.1